tara:strand:+ start:551 stop:721 length:171 start_codon:yes stop_codon:yes gene_type:complete
MQHAANRSLRDHNGAKQCMENTLQEIIESMAIMQAWKQVARWHGIMMACNVWPCKV